MILDATFTARLGDGSTPNASCRIHIPTLLVLEIDEGDDQARFRGQTIQEVRVTLPDGTQVFPTGCYLERCSDVLDSFPGAPEPRIFPVGIDLDGFSYDAPIGRGTILCYLPPHLFVEYLNNAVTEDLGLEMPVPGVPEGWDSSGAQGPPYNIGFWGLEPPEALEAIDDLLAWPDLPKPYVPVLRVLRAIIRIERRCGGPLERAELEPLLEYPTASVREYARAHLNLVGRPVTEAGLVRLSTASQL